MHPLHIIDILRFSCHFLCVDTWPAPGKRHVFIFILSIYPSFKSAAGCHGLFYHSIKSCFFGYLIFPGLLILFRLYCIRADTYGHFARFVALISITYSKTCLKSIIAKCRQYMKALPFND